MVDLGPAADRFEPALERHLSAEIGDLLHAEHGTVGGTGSGPFPEGLYRALAVPERRRALYYLLDRESASLDELADVPAGWRAADGDPVGPEERERVANDLREVHVPLFEETGMVTADSEGDELRLRPLSEPVREVIRASVRTGAGPRDDAVTNRE